MLENTIGELAGLGAALAWAIGSMLFRHLGSTIPPLALNLYKGVLAIGMLLLLLLVIGELSTTINARAWAILLISGAIGIGVGDTAFFGALNRLGERRTVLMAETLAPPMTAFIAMVALSEFLSFYAFTGIAITVAGVAWVVVEETTATKIEAAQHKSGIALGLLAALCQSIGAVTSRFIFLENDISPVWSALIRITGGVAILVFWLPAVRQSYFPPAVRNKRLWGVILVTTFIGTFVGITLQQLSIAHVEAGVAQTLIATSALFILPLVVFRGEKISARAAIGAAVAVIGIGILFAVN